MNTSSGQVALVTGASSGIGYETALALAKTGMTVYAAARRLDKLQPLVKAGIRPVEIDVTDEASMQHVVQAITAQHNRIDVLVNNAGYGSYGALEDVPLAEAKRQFEVNLFGLARLIQLCLPHMRKNRSGRIINVSSIGGRFGEPHGAWYHATKFAVEGLSDSLRMELRQFGIDVVVIQPGAIQTEWMGIAQQGLLDMSGKSAYGPLATKHAAMLETAKKQGSAATVVARAVVAAATARKPRTRYAIGNGAKPLLFLRRLLSDRQFDSLMLRAISR